MKSTELAGKSLHYDLIETYDWFDPTLVIQKISEILSSLPVSLPERFPDAVPTFVNYQVEKNVDG